MRTRFKRVLIIFLKMYVLLRSTMTGGCAGARYYCLAKLHGCSECRKYMEQFSAKLPNSNSVVFGSPQAPKSFGLRRGYCTRRIGIKAYIYIPVPREDTHLAHPCARARSKSPFCASSITRGQSILIWPNKIIRPIKTVAFAAGRLLEAVLLEAPEHRDV